METHLPNKFHHEHQKSNVTAQGDGITWLTSGPILLHSIWNVFGHSEIPEQSLS